MFCEQQIIKMAVTHTKYVRGNTATSYTTLRVVEENEKEEKGGGGLRRSVESKTTSHSAVVMHPLINYSVIWCVQVSLTTHAM